MKQRRLASQKESSRVTQWVDNCVNDTCTRLDPVALHGSSNAAQYNQLGGDPLGSYDLYVQQSNPLSGGLQRVKPTCMRVRPCMQG
jgi:hypothetical protein